MNPSKTDLALGLAVGIPLLILCVIAIVVVFAVAVGLLLVAVGLFVGGLIMVSPLLLLAFGLWAIDF